MDNLGRSMTIAPIPCSLQESLARKYCELSQLNGTIPKLIICWPSARMNKFHSLLYKEATRFNFAVENVGPLDDLEKIYWPGPVIFHAHWFGHLSSHIDSETDFLDVIDRLFDGLRSFRRRTGAHLVWTANNAVPHDPKFRDSKLLMRRRIVDEFDLVHLLHEDHADILYDLLGVRPKASFVTPHPHYGPAHPDFETREDARNALGFDSSTSVVLFFGSFRSYKGLELLIETFRRVRDESRPDLRLVLAGFPSDEEYVRRIWEIADGDFTIRVVPSRIPDADIQNYFRAADVVTLPYTDHQLNSGAAALALTFGCQVIAPDFPAFSMFRQYGLTLYDPHDPNSLARCLASSEPRPGHVSAPFLDDHDPTAVSNRFFSGIDKQLDLGDRTGFPSRSDRAQS